MEPLTQALALAVALVGGYTDVRGGKVYNVLTYPAMLAGGGLHLVRTWPQLDGLIFSLQGVAVALGLLLIPYLVRGIGGGDVKLLAAVGSFVGPQATFGLMLCGGLAGGMLALALLARRGQLTVTLFSLALSPRTTLGLVARGKADFPFAVTIPLGLSLWLFISRLA